MPKRKVDWYGPRLRALREEKGLTQAELGRAVNLAGSQINKLETNISQPLLATALDIARALAVPLEDFIPEDARTRLKDQPAAGPKLKGPRYRLKAGR
jgi:transcriptional regulator with XRE-family HTH domain